MTEDEVGMNAYVLVRRYGNPRIAYTLARMEREIYKGVSYWQCMEQLGPCPLDEVLTALLEWKPSKAVPYRPNVVPERLYKQIKSDLLPSAWWKDLGGEMYSSRVQVFW